MQLQVHEIHICFKSNKIPGGSYVCVCLLNVIAKLHCQQISIVALHKWVVHSVCFTTAENNFHAVYKFWFETLITIKTNMNVFYRLIWRCVGENVLPDAVLAQLDRGMHAVFILSQPCAQTHKHTCIYSYLGQDSKGRMGKAWGISIRQII